jgi:hypothetical protein
VALSNPYCAVCRARALEEYQLKSICRPIRVVVVADLDSGLCVQFCVRGQLGKAELFNNFEFDDFLFVILLADTTIHRRGKQ